jgi:hypothetical protein
MRAIVPVDVWSWPMLSKKSAKTLTTRNNGIAHDGFIGPKQNFADTLRPWQS